VITGRQASCSSPATTDRHEHRPTQITAGRLRRSLAAPQHTPAPGRPGTYKRGTAGLSLLRRLSHGVALLSQCVTRVCCRISLYGIKRRLRRRAHPPARNAVAAWPCGRNHDTARPWRAVLGRGPAPRPVSRQVRCRRMRHPVRASRAAHRVSPTSAPGSPSLLGPRHRPTPSHRHQGRLAASLSEPAPARLVVVTPRAEIEFTLAGGRLPRVHPATPSCRPSSGSGDGRRRWLKMSASSSGG
jgi:hypothetical protein